MIFNSIHFLLFFPLVTLLYFAFSHRFRTGWLLLASCYFYLVFKPEYLLILGVTILVDYFAGILIENESNDQKRKWYLALSIVANVGFLAFFKYYNFGIQNFERMSHFFGFDVHYSRIQDIIVDFVMPVGLSFHTFQAMSYTIEVYRKNQKAEKNFLIYALYVMFYPQLVAGPIERPQNVIWQFKQEHFWNTEQAKFGLLLMLRGFFKKCVIADRLSPFVDHVYQNPDQMSGTTVATALVFFAIQIYCDFSGYSDIAIGSARVMGFDLMKNFDRPYFSGSISEFWRKWHISLSTWFRDYVYFPLGGNRVSGIRLYLNPLIVMLISGLWHGASWTFVIWGALNGLALVMASWRDKVLTGFKLKCPRMIHVFITFVLVCLLWVFFRAESLGKAKLIFKRLSTFNLNEGIHSSYSLNETIYCFLLIFTWLAFEYFKPEIPKLRTKTWVIYMVFGVISIYFLGVFTQNQFIYFQF